MRPNGVVVCIKSKAKTSDSYKHVVVNGRQRAEVEAARVAREREAREQVGVGIPTHSSNSMSFQRVYRQNSKV